jgi:hypothetical protein
MMNVFYANEGWELTLLPRMDNDEGNEFWELTLLPRMDDEWMMMLLLMVIP